MAEAQTTTQGTPSKTEILTGLRQDSIWSSYSH